MNPALHSNSYAHSHPHPHQTNCEIELTITHANGVMSHHHYIVPNDNSVQLVCTNINNNQKTIYPLVEIQNQPISGQSSRIARHYRLPGAAPGAATLSSHRAQLRDQAAHFKPQAPHIPISPPPGFPPIPNRLEVPILNSSSNHSNGGQAVRWSTSTQLSSETAVGMQRQPQKGGPYTCPRCGEVFEISQALAAHVNGHYRTEETLEQRKARQAAKYKRKRDHDHNHDHLRLAQPNNNASMSNCGTMRAGGQNLRRETKGESSNANITQDLLKKIKLEPN